MIKIATIIFFCLVVEVFPQTDSIITYFDNNKMNSIIHYRDSVREGSTSFYWENGNLKQEIDYSNGKVEGLVRNYDSTGTLREMYNVEDGKRNGPTTLFDSAGTYVKDVSYKDGLMVVEKFELDDYKSRQLANKNENKNSVSVTEKKVINGNNPLPEVKDEAHNYEDDPAYYLTVEVMPEPVGGMESIYKRLRYPKEAKEEEIEGTVKILAFIDRDGEVVDAQVLQGIGYGCDEAARQAVFYHHFKPGLQRGQKVKVQMVIPIEFKLDKTEK
jgi:TonB family protein